MPPVAFVTDRQSQGMGSRGRVWESKPGDLLVSLALNLHDLPDDLPLASASIYFGYLFKKTVQKNGSKTFLKWPNDIYLEGLKCGGLITIKTGMTLICGLGVNLSPNHRQYGVLDVKNGRFELLYGWVEAIKKRDSWKTIFSKYEVEFYSSLTTGIYHKNFRNVDRVVLHQDGSVTDNGERVYSLR